MKRTMGWLAAATAAVLMFAGCSTSGGGGNPPTGSTDAGGSQSTASGDAGWSGKFTIGVSISLMDEWLQLLANAVTDTAQKDGGSATIVSAEGSSDTQLNQVENFISQHVDAIIVNPVDTETTDQVTQAAADAKIPLVYVNRCPDNLPDNVPCVGSDGHQAGTLEMTELAKQAGGQGGVAIIEGDPLNNGQAVTERTAGCKDVVAQNSGMKVVLDGSGKWTRDDALALVENWLQTGTEFKVICANNDEMALGAIQALKAAGKLGDVLVGGVDATQDALTAVGSGEEAATVFQDAAGQGGGAVDAAVKLINGENVGGQIMIPFKLVTKDNVADFK